MPKKQYQQQGYSFRINKQATQRISIRNKRETRS